MIWNKKKRCSKKHSKIITILRSYFLKEQEIIIKHTTYIYVFMICENIYIWNASRQYGAQFFLFIFSHSKSVNFHIFLYIFLTSFFLLEEINEDIFVPLRGFVLVSESLELKLSGKVSRLWLRGWETRKFIVLKTGNAVVTQSLKISSSTLLWPQNIFISISDNMQIKVEFFALFAYTETFIIS
jgi:hypothetical protein